MRPRGGPAAGSYQPGTLYVDDTAAFSYLDALPPDRLLDNGLPTWWLLLQSGRPANGCFDGALVLREAFAQLGVRAEPKLVTLTVHDTRSGMTAECGDPAPDS